jgi:putative flippase GtrA
MFQYLRNNLKQTQKQFIKYTFVGSSGVVFDIGLLALATSVLGIIPWIAVALTQIIVLTYNFTLNKLWSFRSTSMPHAQILRYAILASWNYVFSVLAMYIFNGKFEFPYLIVRILTIMVMVLWNFLLYKHWVYKKVAPSVEKTNNI